MRNTKRHEALLGVGLLSAITVLGAAQPTLAKPDEDVKQERKDLKEARKELKREKKDVRKADTRRDRRQEHQDVKVARQNLQTQRTELKQERWENKSNRNNTNRRYDYRRNDYNRRNGYNRSDLSSLEGVVTSESIRGNLFHIRLNGGGQITVRAQGGVPGRLDRGDRVRIYGRGSSNGVFYARSVTILRDR
jgi:Ni/Co efflux regulator RcnB